MPYKMKDPLWAIISARKWPNHDRRPNDRILWTIPDCGDKFEINEKEGDELELKLNCRPIPPNANPQNWPTFLWVFPF